MSNIFYGGGVCKEIYITLSTRKVGTQQQFDRLRPDKTGLAALEAQWIQVHMGLA